MATQYFAYVKMLVTKGYRKLKCSDMKLSFVVSSILIEEELALLSQVLI